MRKLNFLLIFMLLFISGSIKALSCYNTVGYMPSWIGNPADVDYSKYTHINYAFGIPNTNGTVGAIENASKLSDLVTRAHANNTKVFLAIGGWLSSSPSNTPFESIAVNSSYITTFVNTCASLITQYNLDGIDVDWEYPNSQARWNAIIAPLVSKIHSMGKQISAAVPANGYNADMIGDISGLDLVNIMAYDCGCPTVAPYSQAVDALNYWTARGVPQAKRMLGVPFYSSDNYTALHVQKANLAKTNAGGIMIWDIGTYYGDINAIVSTLGSLCKGITPSCTTFALGTIQAESYCTMSGIQTETTTDAGGGSNVGYIDAGDWMSYKINIPATGAYTIQYRIASQSGGGSMRFEKLGGGTYGTISVPSTGGWQTWTTISQTVNLTAGVQDFAIAAAAGGFNINWFSIQTNSNFYQRIEAESYVSMTGVQTESCSEGGSDVGWIDATDWMSYNVNLPSSGTYTLKYRVASPNATGVLILSKNATDVNVVTIPNSGGWQNWTTISQNITLSAGSQSLALYARTGGFNVNWWSLEYGANGTKSGYEENNAVIAQTGNEVLIYPNPATDVLKVELTGESHNASLSLLDLSGRIIENIKLTEDQHMAEFNMNAVKTGVYLIRISNDENNQIFKVIKK